MPRHTTRLSVGLPPGRDTLASARVAEQLGYERVWLFDSAGLYEDIWIHLARLAEGTELDLGTAVLVPNLRHVVTTAAAIATVEGLAPGRLACGFGTGATARWVLGQPALSWATTRRYVEAVRALLLGEVVDVDGAACQMIHTPGFAPTRPIHVPLLLSALGPKGRAIAREIADGVITIGGGVDDMDWHVQMVSGTVLAAGEDLSTPRVQDALGPWHVILVHGAWQAFPAAVVDLPGGASWCAAIDAERVERERHLVVHEGHATTVTTRDRPLVDAAGPMLGTMGWVGSAEEIRARAEAALAAGATELLYTPAGRDVVGELTRFATAVLG